MGIKPDLNIVKIPTFELIKLNFFAVVWGLWYILRRFLKKIWSSNVNKCPPVGNPPKCLTDSTLGQHSYIKIKDVKLHYIDAGDKTKPLVLLLHGFPDCWISWRHQIPELAEHFRVIALDLKGYGDSDKPESTYNYQISNLVKEITDLVTTLGYRRCTLIGHDLGGLIGWYIVHMNPDIINKFISISAPHPNLYWDTIPRSCEINSRWVQFCQLPVLPERNALDDDLKLLNLVYTHLDKEVLDAYRYSFSRREDWIGAINYFRTLPLWRLKKKNSYQVAALLIVGNKDNSVLMESMIKSCDYFEKFAVKIIDGANHYPHQEKPYEINKILKNYLIGAQIQHEEKKVQSNGIVNRVFGAVSSTVKYGNTVIDAVQKTTNDLTSRALYMGQNTLTT